jgi:hypothetical protein
MDIFQHAGHPLGLAQNMLGKKEQGIFGAGLHTAGIPIAEVALKGGLSLFMQEDGAEGARESTLLAGDTFLPINVIDPILGDDGSRRAVLHAFGNLALPADNGHPYDRVRIDHHDPNGTLFRVVYPEALNGTDQFTDLASRTSFRHYSQLPGHRLPPLSVMVTRPVLNDGQWTVNRKDNVPPFAGFIVYRSSW